LVQQRTPAEQPAASAQETSPGAPAQAAQQQPAAPPLDLSWMNRSIQWGTRAPVHKQGGLTLGAINIGAYGEIPDHWEDRSRMPRGTFNPTGTVSPSIGGYYLRDKAELWADNAPELYEEAISRRWSSAVQIPWLECRDLPDDVELAVCQVATELSQQASIEIEVVSSWLQWMSYGFHEVKVFLATENFDAGRAFETFRKRALVNGGGLGIESPGQMNRILLESRAGWTETSVLLHFLRGCFTRTLYRYLEAYGPSPVEQLIGRLCLQDKSRHIAYALQHLKLAVRRVPGMDRTMNQGLQQAEIAGGRDDDDPVLWEALACMFGGGVRGMDEGMAVVKRLRRDYVQDYLRCLRFTGIEHQLAPNFAALIEG
jgi:hypothetical protein